MKTNMGSADRRIRLGLAVIIALLYFTDFISGPFAVVLLVIIGILVLTSFFRTCPLYFPFGISTKDKFES